MRVRNKPLLLLRRTTVGCVTVVMSFVGSFGATVPTSGASTVQESAPSAFCSTLISLSKVKPPAVANIGSYKKWITAYLPYYQKLATEAPPSAKPVLSGLVTLMQYESKTSNVLKLASYVASHSKVWSSGWKAFATAAVGCATSMYG